MPSRTHPTIQEEEDESLKDAALDIIIEEEQIAPLQHKNTIIQESMTTIQSWLSSSRLNNLSITAIYYEQKSDKEFSAKVLLELFTADRSKTLQSIIDYFFNNSDRSRQLLSKALSSLTVIALDIPLMDRDNIIGFMSDLFCVSPDSFLYDFIVMASNTEQEGSYIPTLISCKLYGLDLNMSDFVISAPTSVHASFISGIVDRLLHIIASADEIIPLLEYFRDDIDEKSVSIYRRISELSARLNRLRRDDSKRSDMVQNKTGKKSSKREKRYTQLMDNTSMGAYVYHVDTLTLRDNLKSLLLELESLKPFQDYYHFAFTAGVADLLENMKQACRSLIIEYSEVFPYMIQYVRGFIIMQLCDMQSMLLTKKLRAHLIDLHLATQERYISHTEISELQTLAQRSFVFAQTIRDRYEEGNYEPLGVYESRECVKRIESMMSNVKIWEIFNDQVVSVWENLLPVLNWVDQGLGDEMLTQNQMFANAFHQLEQQFTVYRASSLHETATEYGVIGELYKKVALGMFAFTTLELDKLKSSIKPGLIQQK